MRSYFEQKNRTRFIWLRMLQMKTFFANWSKRKNLHFELKWEFLGWKVGTIELLVVQNCLKWYVCSIEWLKSFFLQFLISLERGGKRKCGKTGGMHVYKTVCVSQNHVFAFGPLRRWASLIMYICANFKFRYKYNIFVSTSRRRKNELYTPRP